MIRYAKENELKDIRDIWEYCFNDTKEFTDYYFDEKYKNYNTIIVEENEKIVSSLQLNKYKINLNNKFYNSSYIVGVSTLPEGRGRGYMKEIMKFSLNEMYKNQELISILMPIDFRLYRKFGYENCYDILSYELNIDEIDNFRISGTFKKVNENDLDKLIEIKDEYLTNYNGNILRDKDYYKNLLKETESENGHIYLNDNDGYLIYFINDGEMFVREIYYKNINSLKSMLGFIYNHNTQIKKVIINTPVDDYIRDILKNPKNTKVFVKPFMMGRIINVFGYLKSLEINNNKIIDKNLKYKFKILDEFIEANNKTFEINLNEKYLDIKISDDNCENIIDINTFSSICFSYKEIKKILFEKNLNLSDEVIDLFEILFNKKQNYINEYV